MSSLESLKAAGVYTGWVRVRACMESNYICTLRMCKVKKSAMSHSLSQSLLPFPSPVLPTALRLRSSIQGHCVGVGAWQVFAHSSDTAL